MTTNKTDKKKVVKALGKKVIKRAKKAKKELQQQALRVCKELSRIRTLLENLTRDVDNLLCRTDRIEDLSVNVAELVHRVRSKPPKTTSPKLTPVNEEDPMNLEGRIINEHSF